MRPAELSLIHVSGKRTPPAGQVQRGAVRRISPDQGKGLTIGGAGLTIIFGIGLLTSLPLVALSEGFFLALAILSPVIGFLIGGIAMIWAGTQRTKKARRFTKYLALIGRRESCLL